MKRKLSLLLATIAIIVVPLLAYVQGVRETRAQLEVRGWACGMPILGLYLLALLISGCLSLVALVLGVLAYRRLPPPRPKRRLLELAIVALPLLLAIGIWLPLSFDLI